MNWLSIFRFDENDNAVFAFNIGTTSSITDTENVFEALKSNSVAIENADYHVDLVSSSDGILDNTFVEQKAFESLAGNL